MKVRVLGCAGGIGGRDLRTTSLLIDRDILIDAGTGVGELSLDELARIDHVFVTHSHLDHVCSIPFMVDSAGALRSAPLIVHALPQTIEALRKHIFNDVIWPDFGRIPSRDRPFIAYEPIALGDEIKLGDRRIVALPAEHVVPALGYAMRSASGNSLVFTGDTGPNPALWPIVNEIPQLRGLIIETAFCDKERALAVASKHLCPSMLADELERFKRDAPVFITHLKPGEFELTMDQIFDIAKRWSPRMLANGHVFEL